MVKAMDMPVHNIHGFCHASMGNVMAWQNSYYMTFVMLYEFCHAAWVLPYNPLFDPWHAVIPVFLVIRIIFHFTPRIPTILLWPSASATCIYDIDYELQGIALNWHHQYYWVDIIISQSHISKVSQSCRMYVERPGPIDRTPETPGSGKNK